MTDPRVAVVGAGAWGTTLAILLGKVEPVLLLAHDDEAAGRIDAARENERRLPGIALPPAVVVSADPAALAAAVDLVVVAVPSPHLRSTVEGIAAHVAPSSDVLTVVKGLEPGSLLRMSEVIVTAAG
ncbi:MAG: glycerol-3-phosphate dehydrogenase, partial [Chloroflexota bacterium]|nr:glycerol-3-phosphate dehydrogenase [Chloroflexota bacterium]